MESALMFGKRPKDHLIRWALHVLLDDGDKCWNWDGSRNPVSGYGNFRWDRKSLAHRYSYERFNGPLIDGLEIDHLCHNRRCVNPAHLEQKTRKGNAENSLPALKPDCIRGHPRNEENTAAHKSTGKKYCKVCARDYQKRRNHALREGLPWPNRPL